MPKREIETKFFTIHQNNARGVFNGPAIYVIVEGVNVDDAWSRVEDKLDPEPYCGCCGDRWYKSWDDGTEVPSIYDTPIDLYVQEMKSQEPGKRNKFDWSSEEVPFAVIYYMDGTEKTVRTNE